MEYGDEVAEYEVGVHYARLVVVVASGLGCAQVVVVDLCVAVASRVGKLWACRLYLGESGGGAGVDPHVGRGCEHICLLKVDWARSVAAVFLVYVVASGVGDEAHGIVVGRGHEP